MGGDEQAAHGVSAPRRGHTRRAFVAAGAAGAATHVAGASLLTGTALAASPRKCAPTGPGVPTNAIAVTPEGRTLWTADAAGTTITAHNRRDLVRGHAIDVGGAPAGIAISRDGRTAMVTTAFYDRPGLTVVDLRSHQVNRLDVGAEPYAVAFTPDGHSAYVTGSGSHGTLTRVDRRSGHVHPAIAIGRHPRGLAITPDGAHALVALNGDSAVAVVALATGRITRRVATAPFPYLLAVSPNGLRGFVTHNGYRSRAGTLLNLHTWRAHEGVRTGLDPSGVAFDGSGRLVMVADTGSGTVTLLDAHSGRRRRRLAPGGAPRAVAVAGGRGYVADAHSGRLTAVRL
ncbi:MAG: hypothetical protein QOG68_1912 [Solirubrobacteraceae bacterium]|nr:hypothetical protein [Solirubrobacteraceae bacterium]